MQETTQQPDPDAYYGEENFGDGDIDMSFLDEKPAQ